jgi:opacity protein-like surface antigen
MIGPSFANVTSPNDSTLASSDTLFNAGGALGVAFEREHGRLRLEVEGMGRSTYDAPFTSPLRLDAATVLTDNWSVMQNFWRDLMITDRFGIYGGGGIGAGGYVFGQTVAGSTEYTTPAANFAWQAGGGLLWQLSDRLTFDVGYRYFHINTIQQADDVVPNQFAASELMFSLRLYEPFRNWRR